MHRFFGLGLAIALIGSNPASGGNLVVYGGFEGPGAWFGNASTSTNSAHSGSYGAFFTGGSPGNLVTLYQDLATTPGSSYELDFWLREDGAAGNDFQVYWGSSLVLDSLNAASFPWTEYTYTVTATSSSTELLFQGYEDPSPFPYYLLDDISVTPSSVPEPTSILLLSTGILVCWCSNRRFKISKLSAPASPVV